MAQDEVAKLILDVIGKDKVDALNASLKDETEILEDWIKKWQAGGQVSESAVRGQARAVLDLQKQIAEAQAATRDFSRSGMQLSYIIDDLANTSGSWERHLASISNNIPGFLVSLGLSGGVAGAVSMITTLLIALAPAAKKAWEALSGAPDGPRPVIEMLGKIKKEAQETLAELDKVLKSRAPGVEETAEATRHAFEGRGKEVLGGAAQAIGATGQGEQMTRQELAKLQKLIKAHPGTEGLTEAQVRDVAMGRGKIRVMAPEIDAMRKDIQDRLNRANLETAGRLIDRAPYDRGARDRLRALARANPGAFPPDFERDLADVEPGRVRAMEAESDKDLEYWEDFQARNRKRHKAAKREADDFKKMWREHDAGLRAFDVQRARDQGQAVREGVQMERAFARQMRKDREIPAAGHLPLSRMGPDGMITVVDTQVALAQEQAKMREFLRRAQAINGQVRRQQEQDPLSSALQR